MFATSVGKKISLKEVVGCFAPPHVETTRLFHMSNRTVKYFISNLIARFWGKMITVVIGLLESILNIEFYQRRYTEIGKSSATKTALCIIVLIINNNVSSRSKCKAAASYRFIFIVSQQFFLLNPESSYRHALNVFPRAFHLVECDVLARLFDPPEFARFNTRSSCLMEIDCRGLIIVSVI